MGWHFLRAGTDGAWVQRTIDDLLLPLNNSLNPDVHIAVNTYLSWVETADKQLSSFLASRADVDALYSTRYWQIRSADEATARPFALIEMEQGWQATRLREIKAQLVKYSEMLSLPKPGSVVICDTNVHIHGKLFSQVLWRDLLGAGYVRVLVPLIVVDELDVIKDRGSREARWARRVIKELQAKAPDGVGLGPFRMREGVDLQFVDEPRGHLRFPRADDEIVRQAEYFGGVTANSVVIVSRDRGMLLRAQSGGIMHRELPPELVRVAPPGEESEIHD